MAFTRAVREKVYLKIAITGPSGGGKTYSALRLAFGLGRKVALLDSENGSGSLYADLGEYDTDVLEAPFTHDKYIRGIDAAVAAGYDALIIDSLTHAWEGEGGVLDRKHQLDKRGGNSFTNWNEAGQWDKLLKNKIAQAPLHIISTIRSKQDYVIENGSNGKQAPKKVGLAPVAREGTEYDYTVVFDVAMDHTAMTSKDRTGLFVDQIAQITEEHGRQIKKWLEGGAEHVVRLSEGVTPVMLGKLQGQLARVVGPDKRDQDIWLFDEFGKDSADRLDYEQMLAAMRTLKALPDYGEAESADADAAQAEGEPSEAYLAVTGRL